MNPSAAWNICGKIKFGLMSGFIICSLSTYAQHTSRLPNIAERSFPVFIHEAFRNNFNNRLDTIGLSGFCWVKFKVNTDGTFRNLEVSPGTPVVLSDFIKETLLFTNGLWKDRPTTEWLVLPVRYTLQKEGKADLITPDPFEMEVFFADQDGMNRPSTMTLLPALEFESPFDGENNFKRMKLQQAGKRE